MKPGILKSLTFRASRPKLVFMAFLTCAIGILYWTGGSTRKLLNYVPKLGGVSTVEKEDVLQRVYHLQEALAKYNMSEDIHRQLNEIVSILGGADSANHDVSKSNSNSLPSMPEVCPEVWLGPGSDYPFYYQGWKLVNCSNVIPFHEVLTVVIYFYVQKNVSCPQTAQSVISGLNKLYPKVPVIISGISKKCIPNVDASHVRFIDLSLNVSTPGVTWNYLTKLVTTPYVLVGRDLDDFIWTANLERAVRVLSYNRSLSVAGGAVRNQTGHWRVGCFQVSMKNYVLEYLEGYYASRNECMFCDHLAGPFVTRTQLVQTIQFDEALPVGVLFEDWFWRLQQKSHIVVNCPDVMYLASDPVAESKLGDRLLWVPLIRKWELNRLVLPGGRVLSYSCAESNISCERATDDTNSFLIPICCLEQYASAFKVFHDLCLENQIRYELDTGSALGAVKVNGLMPWDVDADNVFYTANYSFFQTSKSYFKKNDIILRRFSRSDDKSYFRLYTPDVSVEMWGQSNLSHDNVTFGEPFRLIPTKVFYHGYWVYAPHNPATFARGRYGPEVLKHSHHWRHSNMKNSWQVYKPGQFNKCKKPGHHACLDQFSADGNLQFSVPNGIGIK